jgi:hypothetical protein
VKTAQGKVFTADNTSHDIRGTGESQIQQLNLKNVQHVPSFKQNLGSGTQLLKDGYDILITKNKFEILQENKKVAEGILDKNTDLVLFESPGLEPSTGLAFATTGGDWKVLHDNWGHVSPQVIAKILRQTPPKTFYCQPCTESKTNRNVIPKNSNTIVSILEAVEIDLQFVNQPSRDGTTINMKAIDVNSGFLLMEPLQTKSAKNTANFLRHYIPLLQNQSGNRIKNVRTDEGTKFMGEFQQLLNQYGIIHQAGHAYNHHIPGKVERSHQTIQKRGLAMLAASNLPQIFYMDAFKMAVYIFNRTIHGNQEQKFSSNGPHCGVFSWLRLNTPLKASSMNQKRTGSLKT